MDYGNPKIATAPVPLPAGANAAWHGQSYPYGLITLRMKVNKETNTCWLLVGAAALASWPVGMLLGQLVLGLISFVFPVFYQSYLGLNNPSTDLLFGLSTLVTYAFSAVIGLLIPLVVVLLALYEYRRSYRFAAGDLIWNDIALFLLHEEYGAMIDHARREHYRPNPNPVELGDTLAQRLQHFAAYYPQYRKLARPHDDLKLPLVVERNCWSDGLLLLLGGCSVPCCIGLVLTPIIVLRVLGTWPKQIAVKQAVLHFFEGRFDHAFPNQ